MQQQNDTIMLKDTDELAINGVSVTLPADIAETIRQRSQRGNNVRFVLSSGCLQVRCSACGSWFTMYMLEKGEWVEEADCKYIQSVNRKSRLNYYGSYCIGCSKKRKDKMQVHLPDEHKDAIQDPPSGEKTQDKTPWTIQLTIKLTKQNDEYLWKQQYLKREKRNKLINDIIDSYRASNEKPQ